MVNDYPLIPNTNATTTAPLPRSAAETPTPPAGRPPKAPPGGLWALDQRRGRNPAGHTSCRGGTCYFLVIRNGEWRGFVGWDGANVAWASNQDLFDCFFGPYPVGQRRYFFTT